MENEHQRCPREPTWLQRTLVGPARRSRCAALVLAIGMVAITCVRPAWAQTDTIFADGFELPPAAISPDPTYTGSDSHVAVGGDGRVHMVYSALPRVTDPDSPVRYGECANDCMDVSHWQFVTLGYYGSTALGGGARLALTSAGHPRVWWYQQAEAESEGSFHYARCDAMCGAAASWSVGVVLSGLQAAGPPLDSPFALDGNDRPHFFLQNFNGVYYGSCASSCTLASQWSYSAVPLSLLGTASLDLHFAGISPLFVGAAPGPILNGGGNLISYGGCCNTSGQWVSAAIYNASANSNLSIPLSFALTSTGLPRTAFYQVDASGTGVYRMVYGACDADCGPSGWNWAYPDVPQSAGFAGMALALDGSNHPHIAYSGDPDSSGFDSQSISLATCTSDCAKTQGMWSSTSIETRAGIPLPVPPLTGADAACVADNQWFVGAEPSLALDANNGVYLSWDIDFLESCPDGVGSYFTFSVAGPIRYAQR